MTQISEKKRHTPFALTDLTGRPVSSFTDEPRDFETGIIVSLDLRGTKNWDKATCSSFEDDIKELEQLCSTAGVEVVGTVVQKRAGIHRGHYVGKGKLVEVKALVDDLKVDLVLFDAALTPAQLRNLEKALEVKVIDRTELILDIFAARASSSVGKLQVELAQLNYLLPRLTKMWSHLEGQQGGAGMRGPGETQLETDRRHARKRISKLKVRLEESCKRRGLQREKRRRVPVPLLSLVGYTNVGKSSLLNQITGAGALVEDKLFATLDPLTRRIELKNNLSALLTDTVGFIKKLPHTLVDAFHATLEEVTDSDILLFVIDATDDRHLEQSRVVRKVLNEINAGDIPAITVINKIDILKERHPEGYECILERLSNMYSDSVFVSASTGEGISDLFDAIEFKLRDLVKPLEVVIPPQDQSVVSWLHKKGRIVSKEWLENGGVRIIVEIPVRYEHEIEKYIQN